MLPQHRACGKTCGSVLLLSCNHGQTSDLAEALTAKPDTHLSDFADIDRSCWLSCNAMSKSVALMQRLWVEPSHSTVRSLEAHRHT